MEDSISDRTGQISWKVPHPCSQILQLPKEKQCLENCRRETVPLWKIGKIEKVQM